MNGLTFVERMCAQLNLGATGVDDAIASVIAFGGIDTDGLTPELVKRGLTHDSTIDWHDLAWRFTQLLGYYNTLLSHKTTPIEAAGACITVALLCQAAKMKRASAELGELLGVLYIMRKRFTTQGLVAILEYIVDSLQ